jgi:UDP-glucose 4-epimerase
LPIDEFTVDHRVWVTPTGVSAWPAIQVVIIHYLVKSVKAVITNFAIGKVITSAALHDVVTNLAIHDVLTFAAKHLVITSSASHAVITIVTANIVESIECLYSIVAPKTHNNIVTCGSI